MQPSLPVQTLQSAYIQRSQQQHFESEAGVAGSFSPGTSRGGVMANTLLAPYSPTHDRAGLMMLPAQGAGHIPHRQHAHNQTRTPLQEQHYAELSQPQRSGGQKRSYSEFQMDDAATQATRRLAYQALLERLPVNPTPRSVMCAFLRDELREILRMNRLSYHKAGADNKVGIPTWR